ncbi:MAG: hypothetical protein HY827_00555 [Actinobacteria bacterium]|nr:hypothetical protein [Actinomycetota bacterium]
MFCLLDARRIATTFLLACSISLVLGVGGASASAVPQVLGVSLSDTTTFGKPTGLTAGGTTVKVRGSGFTAGATVAFGANAASSVTVDSDSQITAVSPAGAEGTVDVRVTTMDGTSAINVGAKFRYGQDRPTGLSKNAAGVTQVALRWQAPAILGVQGYTVYRDGVPVGLPITSGLQTNFVDTGLSAGTAYTYTVSAQTLSGSTPLSDPLSVTTGTATVVSQCSAQGLQSGHYVVSQDLLAPAGTGSCLTIIGNNVSLDCQLNSVNATDAVPAVQVSGASGFLIRGCVFPASNDVGQIGGLNILNSTDGTITGSLFLGLAGQSTPNTLSVYSSSRIAVIGNSGDGCQTLYTDVQDSYIGGNTLTAASYRGTAGNIAIANGSGNVIDGNTLHGATANPPSGNSFFPNGADDGVVMENEVNDVVVRNSADNMWDAGVETVGYAANLTIANNTVDFAWIAAIGAYSEHNTSWFNNSVIGNTASNSRMLFRVESGDYPAGQVMAYLQYNRFESNLASQPLVGGWQDASGLFKAGSTGATTAIGNNEIIGNRFGSELAAPAITPAAVTTASQNRCRPGAASRLVCDDFDQETAPTVTAVSPSSGAAGTQVSISGSGFAGATVVTFWWGPSDPLNATVPNCMLPDASQGKCFTVNSNSSITAPAPLIFHSNTLQGHVRVTSNDGTRPTGPGDDFALAAAPAPAISYPASWTQVAASSLTVTFSVAAGANSVWCSLLDDTVSQTVSSGSCSPPSVTYASLVDGHQYAISVSAVDDMGNWASAGAFVTANAQIPPAPQITAVTGSPQNGSTIGNHFPTFSGTEGENGTTVTVKNGATTLCTATVAGGTWSCVSGVWLSDATYSNVVAYVTNASNQSADSAPASAFTIDTTLPNPTITSAPPSPTNTTSPTFTFQADEPSTFECSLDNGGYAPCTSPKSYSGVTLETWHSLGVRATDLVGNVSVGVASSSWLVDTTTPAVSISSPANGSSTSNTGPTLTFGVTDVSSHTELCKVDTGSFATCPATLGPLATGSHTVTVQSTDAAGNIGTAVSTFTVLIPQQLDKTLLTVPSGTHSLSTEGPYDWSHWGLTTATSWDHKSGGAGISNVSTVLSGTTISRVSTSVTPTVSWSGGTPTASSSGTATGITTGQAGVGRGVSFTVSGAQTSEAMTLKMYVGVIASSTTSTQQSGKLELYWSSDPGTIVTDAGSFSTTSTTTAANRIYQVTLRPPQPNDTLNVRWTQNTSLARVRLYSATLNKVGVTRSAAPASANLTTDGSPATSLDWAHWGGAVVPTTASLTPIGKSGATAISNATNEGTGTLSQATGTTNPVATAYSWTNGDTTPSASNVLTGISNTGGATGRGFSFTVPADSATMRTLKLYVGATNSSTTAAQPVKLELFWGTSTIPFYTDVVPSQTNSTINYLYTINLRHAAAGTTLKAKWSTNTTSTSHKATLQSAVLVQN